MKKPGRLRRLAVLCLVAACFCVLSVPALAAVPSRPSNQYVLDSAGVLSDATEKKIISENEKLFRDTGAEIAVVAVDFLDGQEIDDYANQLFSYWGIGSKERNNGLLLVLAIAEDNYYALPGYGIEDEFSGGTLQGMLDDYLETDFAAGDYDAGVNKFFDAALKRLEKYEYNDEYDQQGFNPGGAYENYADYNYDSGFSFPGFFVKLIIRVVAIVFVVVIFILVIRVISGIGRGGPGPGSGSGGGGFWTGMFLGSAMRSSRRRRWYNPPPPPPPGGFGPGPRPGGGPHPPRTGGFGGFSGGSRGGFSHGGRSGGHSGAGRSGGFSRGGGSRGGGAGRR